MNNPISSVKLIPLVAKLLECSNDLFAYYPQEETETLSILASTYRKNFTTLRAVFELSKEDKLGSSALDLVRSMIEDMVSIEYIVTQNKEKQVRKFHDHFWVQIKDVENFLQTLGVDPQQLGVDMNQINNEYDKLSTKLKNNKSWSGINVESMLETLYENDVLNEFDNSRLAIAYVYGNWKNHLNPYDIRGYLNEELFVEGQEEALRQALVFGLTTLYRITTRYIDELRLTYNKEVFGDVAECAKAIFDELDNLGSGDN